MLQVQGIGARQQHALEPWQVRMHLDVAAGDLRRDVRSGDVGLLRGETALPERPGRHVAHRPRVLDTAHAP